MRFFFTYLTIAFATTFSFAQGEFNNWYFGTNAGVSFASGAPVALTNGALSTSEGSAVISDAAGNLLFYTDGITVYDRNHNVMPNGNNLKGDKSSCQSGIIVPWPGKAGVYFIFTVDASGGADGHCYSVVDLALNGGLGDVVAASKNTLLYTPSRESLTAVPHANGCDIWVLTHKWNSDEFYAYLVTSAGVSNAPVISAVGRHNGSAGPVKSAIGYLKANRQGTKLALGQASAPANKSMELFDFDKATGIVSNAIVLTTQKTQTYGCEFSPNGNLLYGSSGAVYQFDISSGVQATINASRVVVGNGTYGALQLGPDNKIYQVTTNTNLNVINNPNVVGIGANFVNGAVSLNGKKGFLGLPTFITSWVAPSLGVIEVEDTCEGGITKFSLSDTVGLEKVKWNFGDPASGAANEDTSIFAEHVFSSQGTFTVSLIVEHSCKDDTLYREISIIPGFTVEITSTGAAGCAGGSDAELMANITGGTFPFTYEWSNGVTTETLPEAQVGTYELTVTDDGGCSNTASYSLESDDIYTLFAPNTFTPDGDGINDVFNAKGVCIATFEMYIFDRWGNMVYHTDDKDKGWDGTVNGKPTTSMQDTYVWRIKTTDTFGEEHKYFGHVNIVR